MVITDGHVANSHCRHYGDWLASTRSVCHVRRVPASHFGCDLICAALARRRAQCTIEPATPTVELVRIGNRARAIPSYAQLLKPVSADNGGHDREWLHRSDSKLPPFVVPPTESLAASS